jgi:SAM-dependent methyltransferase
MTDSSSTWTHAQKRERHYYEVRAAAHEARDEVYAEFHAPFWTGILDKLSELKYEDDGCYVDVGCGPNPIVTFVPCGRRVGVDPLMDFYRENFTLPAHLETHEGTIEELSPIEDGSADVIFSMNNIDHIKDLPAAARTLRRKLKPSGYLVISVNIVGNPVASLMAKAVDIYRVVDPTHTYHFHSPKEVVKALSEGFELVRHECIEHLSEEMQERKNQRDHQRTSAKGVVRSGLKFVKNDIILREKLYLLLLRPKATS